MIHEVSNTGEGPARLIGAEVRSTPGGQARGALTAPGYSVVLENEYIRVYRLRLAPGETTGPHTYGFDGLTVALSGGILEVRMPEGAPMGMELTPGQATWHEAPMTGSLRNAGEVPLEVFVCEWRK